MKNSPCQYLVLKKSVTLTLEKKKCLSIPYVLAFRGNPQQDALSNSALYYNNRNKQTNLFDYVKLSKTTLTRYACLSNKLGLFDSFNKNFQVIRPLLDCSRGVLTKICKYGNIPVYPDKSNQSLQYSRNRIRKQILPSIQLFFNPQAEEALVKFAELISQEQYLISRLINTTRQ